MIPGALPVHSLDDLGITPAVVDSAVEQWAAHLPDWRPSDDPVFPGDFLVRMYDAGAPYADLIDWLSRYAFYRKPGLSQAIGWDPTPDPDDSTAPLPTRLGLMLSADELDRDHLSRAGRQVPIFVQPNVRNTADHHRSVFCDAWVARFPSVDIQHVIASSPVAIDRIALTENPDVPVSILRTLARDVCPGVRCKVAYHHNSDASVYLRFGPTPDAPDHIESHEDVLDVLMLDRLHKIPVTLRDLLDEHMVNRRSDHRASG